MTRVRSYSFPSAPDRDPLDTQRRLLDSLVSSPHPLSRRDLQNLLFDDYHGLHATAAAIVELRKLGLIRRSWRSDRMYAPTAAGIADAGFRAVEGISA